MQNLKPLKAQSEAEVARPLQVVDTWLDAVEVLRASTGAPGSDADQSLIRGDTLVRIEGAAHDARRHTMNRLVRVAQVAHLRNEVLLEALQRELSGVLSSPGSDGVARTDLMTLLIRCGVELGASVAGIRLLTDVRRRSLVEIEDVLSRVAVEEASGRETGGCRPEALALAKVVRERFAREFFRPELAERRALLDASRQPPEAAVEPPNDLMSLIAHRADPGWTDEETAIREVVGLIRGAARPTAAFICAALDQLERWVERHSEDRPLLVDSEFLSGAIHETLRLRTPLLAVEEDEAERVYASIYRPRPRVVTSDIRVPSGQVFKAGQTVAVDTRSASRDPAAFGPDAREYNPRRRVLGKGIYPWGLAFGTGPHMCLGLPIVLGARGPDGILVQATKFLLEAGLYLDRERPRVLLPQVPFAFGRAYRTRTFPVAFAAHLPRHTPATTDP